MPLASVYLLSLDPSTTVRDFIPRLLSSLPSDPAAKPLLIARPLRWIIDPWIESPSSEDTSTLKALTDVTWDLLLVFPSVVELPPEVTSRVRDSYGLQAGISSKIIQSFHKTNAALLHPAAGTVPELTGSLDKASMSSTSKDLTLTPEIRGWLSSPSAPRGAPSMLNLLTFRPGKHDSYKAYGQAFAADVGRRRGGNAKIVGAVVGADAQSRRTWDEIAVAHYPTVWHFADMAAGEDYQAANMRHRVPALRGTAILCCDELDADVMAGIEAAEGTRAKI